MAKITAAGRGWELAELECFNYLKTKLEDLKMAPHLGEFPLTIPNKTDARSWMFKMGGSGTQLIIQIKQSSRPLSCRNMAAEWHGRFIDRTEAMRTADSFMNFLPVSATPGDLKYITKFGYLEEEPETPERETLFIKKGQPTGGEVRVWTVMWRLFVVYTNRKN